MKDLRCTYCQLPIEDRKELIVMGRSFGIRRMEVYHPHCCAKAMRDSVASFTGTEVMNNALYGVKSLIALVAALALTFISSLGPLRWILVVVLLIPLLRRAGVWMKYERKLPRG